MPNECEYRRLGALAFIEIATRVKTIKNLLGVFNPLQPIESARAQQFGFYRSLRC